MRGFVDDLEDRTKENEFYRRVLYTGKNLQLAVMSLEPGAEIGEEVHPDRDQFFRVEKGRGEVWIDGHRTEIRRATGILVPAGARHNIRNTGDKPLKLHTLFGPPEHQDGAAHVTKADERVAKERFAGMTSE